MRDGRRLCAVSAAVRSAKARRKRPGGRKSARRQRTTVAGLFLVFFVLVGGLVFLLGTSDTPRKLPNSDLPAIRNAMVHVPATDVTGRDPVGIPRPVGSTRAFFRGNGKILTVIYARSGGYDEVLRQVQADLAAGGWTPPTGRSAGRAPGQAKSWTNVFRRQNQVVQVSIITASGVTSTTYIVQAQ